MATLESISKDIAIKIIRNISSRNVYSKIISKLDNLTYSSTGLSITDEEKSKILDMVKTILRKHNRTIRQEKKFTIKESYISEPHSKILKFHRNRKKRDMIFSSEAESLMTYLVLIEKIKAEYKKIKVGYKNGK
jgi:hypothetical protein